RPAPPTGTRHRAGCPAERRAPRWTRRRRARRASPRPDRRPPAAPPWTAPRCPGTAPEPRPGPAPRRPRRPPARTPRRRRAPRAPAGRPRPARPAPWPAPGRRPRRSPPGRAPTPPGTCPRAAPERWPAAPLRSRCRAGPLRSLRQILPRDVLVHPDLARQPEDSLGDDVAQDLRGPALDGGALAAERVEARAALGGAHPSGAAERPAVLGQPLLAQELHLQTGDLLVAPGARLRRGGPLRAGLADRQLLAEPLLGEPGRLGVHPQPQQRVVRAGGARLRAVPPDVGDHPDQPALARVGVPADRDP